MWSKKKKSSLMMLFIPRSKTQTSDLVRSSKILSLQNFLWDLVTRFENIVCAEFFQDFTDSDYKMSAKILQDLNTEKRIWTNQMILDRSYQIIQDSHKKEKYTITYFRSCLFLFDRLCPYVFCLL